MDPFVCGHDLYLPLHRRPLCHLDPQIWIATVARSANRAPPANEAITDFPYLAGESLNVASVPQTAYKFSPQQYLGKDNCYMWRIVAYIALRHTEIRSQE